MYKTICTIFPSPSWLHWKGRGSLRPSPQKNPGSAIDSPLYPCAARVIRRIEATPPGWAPGGWALCCAGWGPSCWPCPSPCCPPRWRASTNRRPIRSAAPASPPAHPASGMIHLPVPRKLREWRKGLESFSKNYSKLRYGGVDKGTSVFLKKTGNRSRAFFW